MSPSQRLTSSTTNSRLNQINNHIMASARSPSIFTADNVPRAAEDPLFGLMAAYKKDTFDKKVDLGIGAYRDDNAKPWVLPVVKKVGLVFWMAGADVANSHIQADDLLRKDPDLNHEYLPIAGLADFTTASQKLVLGADSPAVREKRVSVIQSLDEYTGLSGLRLYLFKPSQAQVLYTLVVPFSPSFSLNLPLPSTCPLRHGPITTKSSPMSGCQSSPILTSAARQKCSILRG